MNDTQRSTYRALYAVPRTMAHPNQNLLRLNKHPLDTAHKARYVGRLTSCGSLRDKPWRVGKRCDQEIVACSQAKTRLNFFNFKNTHFFNGYISMSHALSRFYFGNSIYNIHTFNHFAKYTISISLHVLTAVI